MGAPISPEKTGSPDKTAKLESTIKAALIAFGLLLGGIFALLARPLLASLRTSELKVQEYADIDSFRKALLERGDEDVKDDRSVSFRSLVIPHQNDSIMFDLLPNSRVRFQQVPVSINSCGFRGPDPVIPKGEKSFRIVLLGDSFAFGWGVQDQETFAHRTAHYLQQLAGDLVDVELFNLGVPGYSTFQEVALFEERGLDLKPDLVLVFFVENDFGLPFFIRSLGGSKMIQSTQFAEIAWKKEDAGTNEQLRQLQDQLDPNRALLKLKKMSDSIGADVAVVINPNSDWRKHRRRLWALKPKGGLYHLPIRDDFMRIVEARGIPSRELSLENDPHPSPLKHDILGQVIAAHLARFVPGLW